MTWPFRAEAEVLEQLSQCFTFPSSYLVSDFETTGFSRTLDVIIDAGWAIVENNQIVQHGNFLLDWSRVPHVNHQYLRNQLKRQAADYAKVGRPHYYPWERLCAEGHNPYEVLHWYATLLYNHLSNPSSMIVGHGFWRFDREVFNAHTQRYLNGYLLPWRLHSVLDTGLLEKAAQTGRGPWAGETLDAWLKRVNNASAKIKWNLEHHSAPKYQLAERYNVDMRLMHTAGFDCVLIHYLLDTFKQLTEILNGQRQTLSGTTT